jgi:hypothetical protein
VKFEERQAEGLRLKGEVRTKIIISHGWARMREAVSIRGKNFLAARSAKEKPSIISKAGGGFSCFTSLSSLQ